MSAKTCLAILLFCGAVAAQPKPALTMADRVRLAEAFRLGDKLGEKVWKDWTKAPFAVLLVTPEYEFLMRHPTPSSDFLPLGYDSLIKADVYYRKRIFSPQLLATFPAINGSPVATIVIGQAERTAVQSSTPWVIVLLHEHFHQLQYSQPNYYPDVAALNLSRGDQSGMWMLNYGFPYEKKEVQNSFRRLSSMLVDAILARPAERSQKLNAYLRARNDFKDSLAADDFRYLSFQFWQEGVARYTEYRVARLAARTFKVSKAFQSLPDYTSFGLTADKAYAKIFEQLKSQKLEESRREVVYPFGAGEALLLDQVNTKWKSRYFVDKFDLGKLYRSGI